MSRQFLNHFQNLGLKGQSEYAQEGAAWKRAAEQALSHPGFYDKSPDLQKRLLDLLTKTVFLTGSGRIILVQALEKSLDGMNYVIPTISDVVFNRLQEERDDCATREVGAFFVASRNRKVGTICLRSITQFTPIDRQVIIAHELTHADDTLTNDFIFRLSAGIETSDTPELRVQYEQALREFSAYETSAVVLNNATDGMFGAYASEMYEKARIASPLGNVTFPDLDNYPDLVGLATIRATAISGTLDQLHDEHIITTGVLLGAMATAGLIR